MTQCNIPEYWNLWHYCCGNLKFHSHIYCNKYTYLLMYHFLAHKYTSTSLSLSSKLQYLFLISSFRRVQNVVCFLLGDSPASDLYMPTFRNTLSVPSSKAFEDGTDRVFRNVGIYKSDAGESPKRKQTTFSIYVFLSRTVKVLR